MNNLTNLEFTLHQNKNETGNLIEINEEIAGFKFNRTYYITNVNERITRGYHAHKKLKQLVWCPSGRIEITLDNGLNRQKFVLDAPEKALRIGPGIWREMEWLIKDSVLCVLASDKYDEEDYIRDYKEFKDKVNEGFWDEKK